MSLSSITTSPSYPPPPPSVSSSMSISQTSMPIMDPLKTIEPLAVRVMRLSKPALYQNIPIYAEEECSSSSAAFLVGQSRDPAICVDHSISSQFLILPYSFGNVFLGEVFSAIVSLHNQSDLNLRDVVLKTDIQTASQRIPLSSSNDPNEQAPFELKPDQSVSRVLHHEVKELGNHSLVCTVSCVDHNGEKHNLKKVFKLPVSKPIDLKTRFIPGPKHDEYYIVADIQNQTPLILNMITVEFEPSPAYSADNFSNMHNEKSGSSESSLVEPWRFIRSNETVTYMFHVKPRDNVTFEQLHSTSVLGKLDIVWMSGFGERGRLQTNQLPKPTPSITTTNIGYLPDIRIFLIRGHGTCIVEEAQKFLVRIMNCTQRSMDISLSFDNTFSKREQFIWIGITNRHLGKLDAHQTYDISLQLVPITCGLKRIGGLRVTDLSMRQTYDLEDFHNLFVLTKPVH